MKKYLKQFWGLLKTTFNWFNFIFCFMTNIITNFSYFIGSYINKSDKEKTNNFIHSVFQDISWTQSILSIVGFVVIYYILAYVKYTIQKELEASKEDLLNAAIGKFKTLNESELGKINRCVERISSIDAYNTKVGLNTMANITMLIREVLIKQVFQNKDDFAKALFAYPYFNEDILRDMGFDESYIKVAVAAKKINEADLLFRNANTTMDEAKRLIDESGFNLIGSDKKSLEEDSKENLEINNIENP